MGIFSQVFSSARIKESDVLDHFDVHRYLGKWYEVARLDYKWEKDLENVTAICSLRRDGMIRVQNRGFDLVKQEWKEVTGKAKFAGEKSRGQLKVSFFGPFYDDYNIIALDPDYRHALVMGRNTTYMWILSRKPEMPDDIKQHFLLKASSMGVDIDQLVWVKHFRDLAPHSV